MKLLIFSICSIISVFNTSVFNQTNTETLTSTSTEMKKKILFVVTSHSKKGSTGESTGYYLSEVAHPWEILSEAGYEIDFVSPNGGAPPVEGLDLSDPTNKKFWEDKKYHTKIQNTMKPQDIRPSDYEAIFFAGGHGTMWDFPENKELSNIAAKIYENNGIVSAVCHGPAGLINIKLSNGSYLVKGKKVSGFSNDEEIAVKLEKVVPFSLEDKLKERQGIYIKSKPFTEQVTVDGLLITGQNPQSAPGVGKAILNALKHTKEFSVMLILEIKSEYREEFKKRMINNVNNTNHEPGNISMFAYQDEKDFDKLYIFEKWQNKTAFDEHVKKPWFKEGVEPMYKNLKKPVEIVYLNDLAPMDESIIRNTVDKVKEGYVKVLFIDTKKGKQSDFSNLYQKAIVEFRKEPGVILYQIFADQNNPTRFITHEIFKNEAAFQAHLVFPPVNPVLDFLNTSVKTQPFQKGLHTLIPFAPTMNKQENNNALAASLEGVQHFGITVQDISRAIEFYTEVLGGTLIMRDGDFQGETIQNTLMQVDELDAQSKKINPRSYGIPDMRSGAQRLDVAFISFGNVVIELLQYRDATQTVGTLGSYAPKHDATSPAFPTNMHVSFQVSEKVDFNQFVKNLEAEATKRGMKNVKCNRITTISNEQDRKDVPLSSNTFQIKEGPSNGWSLCYCKGPEGEQLEFNQVNPPVKEIFEEAKKKHLEKKY